MIPFEHDIANRYFCFIYVKDGQRKVFSLHDIQRHEQRLKREGWEHISTINPVLWIEYLINAPQDEVVDIVAQLRLEFKTND